MVYHYQVCNTHLLLGCVDVLNGTRLQGIPAPCNPTPWSLAAICSRGKPTWPSHLAMILDATKTHARMLTPIATCMIVGYWVVWCWTTGSTWSLHCCLEKLAAARLERNHSCPGCATSSSTWLLTAPHRSGAPQKWTPNHQGFLWIKFKFSKSS